MKCGFSILLILGVFWVSGCKKEATSAAIYSKQLASRAAQAMVDKQYQKTRSLSEEAVRLDPDFAEAWVVRGNACALLGDLSVAKESYERALQLHVQRYRKAPNDAGQLVQQVYVLFLLGRDTEARDLLAQGLKTHSTDQQLNMFSKGLDGLLSDKEFQKLRAVQR